MKIRKGKLSINLVENEDLLIEQYSELRRLVLEIRNSPEFRVLYGKTQVSEKPMLNNDVRSRGEHSMNVSTISREIVEELYEEVKRSTLGYIADRKAALTASNITGKEKRIEDLEKYEQSILMCFNLNKKVASLYATVIGLSHDLGHTPFGHIGESVINDFMLGIDDEEERREILQNRRTYFGDSYEERQGHDEEYKGSISFEHNEQSAIILQKIAARCGINPDLVDMNKIILGILSHSRNRYKDIPDDLIAQVVRQADKICYINYDYEELKNAIDFRKTPLSPDVREYLRKSLSRRIKYIEGMIEEEAVEKGQICDNGPAMSLLKRVEGIYKEPAVYLLGADGTNRLLKGENCERSEIIIKKLLEYYWEHPENIPQRRYVELKRNANFTDKSYTSLYDLKVATFRGEEWFKDAKAQRVVSFVISLTNEDAYKLYYDLVNTRITRGKGYGIEPITQDEINLRKKYKLIEEQNNVLMQEKLNAMQEGVIRSEAELDSIARIRIKGRRFANRQRLSELARKAMNEQIANIQKDAEIDETLRKRMEEADRKRESSISTDDSEVEL